MEYKEVAHLGCKFLVNQEGDVYSIEKDGIKRHRHWRKNKDGYWVVSGTKIVDNKVIGYATIAVHLLVAKAFVPGYQEGLEVNHKDFNRANPSADNLEWVTHKQNVHYSVQAGHYVGQSGEQNPNYHNDALHKRYQQDKAFAKEKQSRPRSQNGRAKRCYLTNDSDSNKQDFDCQVDAVEWLLINIDSFHGRALFYVLQKLKRDIGYQGWYLHQY